MRLIRKDNPLPAVCGLICEHPCEVRCRRTMIDDPINIRGLKRFAVDHAGDVPLPVPAAATGKKVAVIGGGPGGISAAYYLTLMGHQVTIYEQRKQLGGMLRYGIPNYRLPREELDREINHILSLGIQVKTEVTVGEDPSIGKLRQEYDAVYIAIGAHIDRKIGIEGEDAQGVISAVELFERYRRRGDAGLYRKGYRSHRRRQRGHGCGPLRHPSGSQKAPYRLPEKSGGYDGYERRGGGRCGRGLVSFWISMRLCGSRRMKTEEWRPSGCSPRSSER